MIDTRLYGQMPRKQMSYESAVSFSRTLIEQTQPITQICYIVPGFKQDFGSFTLLWRCWARLQAVLCKSNQTVQVRLWNNDWKAEAKWVKMISEGIHPGLVDVVLVGYSWGAGWGCTEFARCLDNYGVEVKHACLIDPVFRHKLLVLRWLAYFPSVPIKIPGNVWKVTHWRQTLDKLQGHVLEPVSKHTEIVEAAVYDNVSHRRMDNMPEIISGCQRIVLKEFNAEVS